jgi:hypothetical protein
MSDGGSSDDVLARARQAWSPNAADQERVRRAIGAALAAGAPMPDPTAARSARWGTRLLAAGTIAAASGGIGYWAGYRAGHRESRPIAALAAAAPPVVTGAPLARSSAPDEAPSITALVPNGAHHGGHSARHDPESSAPTSDSLAVEVRALRNAERALRDGNPGLALAFLEQLDRQVPHGRLTEERSAVGTLARCAGGDHPFGVNLAEDFADRYPTSVYRARVEQACAATDSERAGDSPSRRSGP